MTQYYRGIGDTTDEGRWTLDERYADVARSVTFEPTDAILDVGCAEGLIAIEVARHAGVVLAIDIDAARISLAETLAADRGIRNVTFIVDDVSRMRFEARAFDVVLFLGVYHHLPEPRRREALTMLLDATRRVLVMRTPLARVPGRLADITTIAMQAGFSPRVCKRREPRGGDLILLTRNTGDMP